MTLRPTHAARSLAKQVTAAAKTGAPLRHARGVVVSSNIGQTVVTLDGGSTHVTAFNYGHTQNLAAGTVVDVLLVGNPTVAYVLGAYQPAPGALLRAYRNAAWSTVGGSTPTGFGWDTVTFDVTSSYNTSTGIFTCPYPGYYRSTARTGWAVSGTGQYGRLLMYRNGSVYSSGPYALSPQAPEEIDPSYDDVIDCAKGDTLEMYYSATTASQAGDTGSASSYWNIEYLGQF